MSVEEKTESKGSASRRTKAKIEPVIRKDRQLKYTGNILKIYEDTVIANGHEAHWDYIHHDGAAAVVAVADDGQLLMVRQYCKCPWTGRRWRFRLASWMRRMNRRLSALYRELEEETGYRCEKLEYLMSLNTTVAFAMRPLTCL